MFRRALVGVGIGLAAALVALLLRSTELVGRLEDATYDLRVRQTATPVPVPSRVAVVEIDESTLRTLEPQLGRWPWPRLVHASLIDYLTRAGAKAMVYDVIFAEETAGAFEIAGQRVSGDDFRLRASSTRCARPATSSSAADADLRRTSSPPRAETRATRRCCLGSSIAPGDGFQERISMTTAVHAPAAGGGAASGTRCWSARPTDRPGGRCRSSTNRGVAMPSLGLAGALFDLGLGPDDVRLDGRVLRLGGPADTRAGCRRCPPRRRAGRRGRRARCCCGSRRPARAPTRSGRSCPTLLVRTTCSSQRTTSPRARGHPSIPSAFTRTGSSSSGFASPTCNEQFTTPFGPARRCHGVELHAMLTRQHPRASVHAAVHAGR